MASVKYRKHIHVLTIQTKTIRGLEELVGLHNTSIQIQGAYQLSSFARDEVHVALIFPEVVEPGPRR